MNRLEDFGCKRESEDSQKRTMDLTHSGLVTRIGILLLFITITITGCSSSRSKRATNGGESHFLASCQPKCEQGLECICGVCTRICEDDEDCDGLLDATCVSPELLESVRECESTDPAEESVCDVGCSDDDDCADLGEDATCESGYCRLSIIEKLNADSNEDAGSEDNPETAASAGSLDQGDSRTTEEATDPSLPDAEETSESDSYDPYAEEPEDRERRRTIIGQYCSLIEQYPCLTWSSFLSNNGISVTQSIEEQVADCEVAIEIDRYRSVEERCRNAVEKAMQCQIEVDYECPCIAGLREGKCNAPALDSYGLDTPCRDEIIAYHECIGEQNRDDPPVDVTGDRAMCSYDMKPNDPGDCRISCLAQPFRGYGADCDGPPDGPLECRCDVMGNTLVDVRRLNYAVYGEDCAEVAQAMADGKCLEILDCCFNWVDENGAHRCGCTADRRPLFSPFPGLDTGENGSITCQEVANYVNGEVVDLCPEFIGPPDYPFPQF